MSGNWRSARAISKNGGEFPGVDKVSKFSIKRSIDRFEFEEY